MFGPKRRGGLRFWVISTLGNGPKNGAEITNEMEKVSMGLWRPSPGSIYPLLDDMSKEGLIVKGTDGKYSLTDRGREEPSFMFGHQGHHRHQWDTEEMLREIESYLSYMEDLATSDKSKLQSNSSRLKAIEERLTKLNKTLENN